MFKKSMHDTLTLSVLWAPKFRKRHSGYLISYNLERLIVKCRNHALNVTQRHTTTTYSVAACLSRVADAEWQKSCESIRRFSPTIGPLGEWRALCEGGWSGSVPQGLPDLDASNAPQAPQAARSTEEDTQQMSLPAQEEIRAETPEFRESAEQLPPAGHSPSPLVQRDPPLRDYNHPANGSPAISGQNPYSLTNSEGQGDSTLTSLEPPRLPFVNPNTGSVRSLSAFPTPPTHFPLPPPRQQPQHPSISQSTHSSTSNLNHPPQQMDSPVSANDDRAGLSEAEELGQPEYQQYALGNPGLLPLSPERTPERPQIQGRESNSISPATTSQNDLRQRVTQPQMTMPTDIRQKSFENLASPYNQDDYQDNGREFGMDYHAERPTNPQTSDSSKSRPSLERVDTGSSIVAAMRNRFSNAVPHFHFLIL